MTPAMKELYREHILMSLCDAVGIGLPQDGILIGLKSQGYVTDQKELATQMEYLEDKGLIASKKSEVSVGVKRYRITAAGREYAEEKGLA